MNNTLTKTKRVKEDKGSTGIESFVNLNPRDAAAIESVKDIYKEIGALAVSIDTTKAAEKKLKAKQALTEDGKKLAGVKAKLAADKKKMNDMLSMYKGQLLLCRKQNTELPAEIINAKLLNS